MTDITPAEAAKLANWLESPQAIAVVANAVRADVEQQIAEAVVAERERCAQLAEQLGAKYLLTGRDLAALLRKDHR